MLKNILIVGRKLASAALNFLIVYFETIALPMSWALGGTIMFTMYTELSNIFNGAVCLLVGLWQLGCVFTGRELPLWRKRLKFISTSCLACRWDRSGGRWSRPSYTACMICTGILQGPLTAPIPLCGCMTRPSRRR